MNPAADRTDLRQTPRRFSLARRAGVRTLELLSSALGGRAFYRRRHLRAPGLRVRHERLASSELPAGLDGFRLVQLSDLHAGPFLRAADLAGVIELANSFGPDAVAFTGDLITHEIDDARGLAAEFGRLRARHGVFAVFGNHDYRGRREAELVGEFGAHGVTFLRNASHRIEREDGVLALVGVEDLEESRHVDLDAARSALRPGDFEIVLCHHPSGGPLFARPRCLAVLSGHTHATQIDLPFARRAGPPHPGARVDFGGTRLIVNRGLGTIGFPLRVGAPTEIVVVELARSAA